MASQLPAPPAPVSLAPTPWFKQRTTWAMIVGIAVTIGGALFGLEVNVNQQAEIIEAMVSLSTGLAFILGIIFRLLAERKKEKQIAHALSLPPPPTATPTAPPTP